jgi:hypothetical protein
MLRRFISADVMQVEMNRANTSNLCPNPSESEIVRKNIFGARGGGHACTKKRPPAQAALTRQFDAEAERETSRARLLLLRLGAGLVAARLVALALVLLLLILLRKTVILLGSGRGGLLLLIRHGGFLT